MRANKDETREKNEQEFRKETQVTIELELNTKIISKI